MNTQTIIECLNQEWEPENGFLGKVRYRVFDQEGLERLIKILESIELENDEHIDRKLVSSLWFIPIFLEWQKQSFIDANKDAKLIDSAIQRIMPLLYKILGVP